MGDQVLRRDLPGCETSVGDAYTKGQITIDDLDLTVRQHSSDASLLAWLSLDCPSEPIELVKQVLDTIDIKTGSSVLHWYCGKSPALLYLNPNVYYEGIDPNAQLQALNRGICPQWRFTAEPVQTFVYGDVLTQYDVVWANLPLDAAMTLGGYPYLSLHYTQGTVTPADMIVELACRSMKPTSILVLCYQQELSSGIKSFLDTKQHLHDFVLGDYRISVYGSKVVSVTGHDPGPFQVLAKRDHWLETSKWSESTVVDRMGDAVHIRFGRIEDACTWAHEVLRNQPARLWDDAFRYYRRMMHIHTFHTLGDKVGFIKTIPLSPSLKRYLQQKEKSLQLMSYPDNCKPEHRYWTYGKGQQFKDEAGQLFEVMNVVIDPNQQSPPKLYLEPVHVSD